jgi:general secretion pathway protein G
LRPGSPSAARRGFTLIECLLVVVIVATIAAVAVPHVRDRVRAGREAALRANLRVMRCAIDRFHRDTGLFPNTLANLTVVTPPTTARNAAGTTVPLPPGSYRGPYLTVVPRDPVHNNGTFSYLTSAPNVGRVRSASTVFGSNGVRYRDW